MHTMNNNTLFLQQALDALNRHDPSEDCPVFARHQAAVAALKAAIAQLVQPVQTEGEK